jgi:hypothetical protein
MARHRHVTKCLVSKGRRALRGTSRSWTITKDDATSIKREELDVGGIDFADVSTGKRLPLLTAGKFCGTISCSR